MHDSVSPIYRTSHFTKNGKHYNLGEAAWIFDCPHCETIQAHHSQENAITHMDVHFFHIHPKAHVPLVDNGERLRIAEMFYDFRLRTFSPVGRIRDAAR